MYKYLVKLTPLEPYFFGGNINFHWDNKEDKKASRYLIKSRELPQQTTLLGMIRKEILISNHDKKMQVNGYPVHFKYKENIREYDEEDKKCMRVLIGNRSFNMENPPSQYGIIKSVSPIFLLDKENNTYIKMPYDYNSKGYKPFVYRKGKLSGYDPKMGIVDSFMNIDTFNICEKNIFRDLKKIGIDKEKKDEAYFKTIFKVMDQDFSFAFILNTSEEVNIKTKIAYMGAKKSAFKLEISEVDKDYLKIPKETNKIILISDTYIKENIYDKCLYAITDVVEFNNIQTTYGKGKQIEKKNIKYNLLKAGSVLCPKEGQKEEILKMINIEGVRKIGYNHTWEMGDTNDEK